jgi:hypothetical protein
MARFPSRQCPACLISAVSLQKYQRFVKFIRTNKLFLYSPVASVKNGLQGFIYEAGRTTHSIPSAPQDLRFRHQDFEFLHIRRRINDDLK